MGTTRVAKDKRPSLPPSGAKADRTASRRVEKKDSRAISKNQKIKERRQRWTAKLQQVYTEQQQTSASRKAPLEHFERIQDSLAGIEAGIKERAAQTPQSSVKPHPKPISSRRRGALLAGEMERFRRVLNHPQFRKDPIGTIHQHLTLSLQSAQLTKHQ